MLESLTAWSIQMIDVTYSNNRILLNSIFIFISLCKSHSDEVSGKDSSKKYSIFHENRF